VPLGTKEVGEDEDGDLTLNRTDLHGMKLPHHINIWNVMVPRG